MGRYSEPLADGVPRLRRRRRAAARAGRRVRPGRADRAARRPARRGRGIGGRPVRAVRRRGASRLPGVDVRQGIGRGAALRRRHDSTRRSRSWSCTSWPTRWPGSREMARVTRHRRHGRRVRLGLRGRRRAAVACSGGRSTNSIRTPRTSPASPAHARATWRSCSSRPGCATSRPTRLTVHVRMAELRGLVGAVHARRRPGGQLRRLADADARRAAQAPRCASCCPTGRSNSPRRRGRRGRDGSAEPTQRGAMRSAPSRRIVSPLR